MEIQSPVVRGLAPCHKGYSANCLPMNVTAIKALLGSILVGVTEKQCPPVVLELLAKDYTDDCHSRNVMTVWTLLDINPVNVTWQ